MAVECAMLINLCTNVVTLLYMSRANRFAYGHTNPPPTNNNKRLNDPLTNLFYELEAQQSKALKNYSLIGIPNYDSSGNCAKLLHLPPPEICDSDNVGCGSFVTK